MNLKSEHWLVRLNRMAIMSLLGVFTVAELMYIAPEYTCGLRELIEIIKMVLS